MQPQLGVLQFDSILTSSTWTWHWIPQAKGSVPRDHPTATLDASHKSGPSPVILRKWRKSEASTMPSPGSINWLEWLMELRKTS